MVLATVPEAPPTRKEPACDLLSGTDFGERTERGGGEIQGKRFVMSIESLSGRHGQGPVGQMFESYEASLISAKTSRARKILLLLRD